jgi:hypothetical protein
LSPERALNVVAWDSATFLLLEWLLLTGGATAGVPPETAGAVPGAAAGGSEAGQTPLASTVSTGSSLSNLDALEALADGSDGGTGGAREEEEEEEEEEDAAISPTSALLGDLVRECAH